MESSKKKRGEELIKKGEIQYKNLEWDEALKTFEKALDYVKNARLYFNISLIYFALGNFEKTEEFLSKLFDLEPSFELNNHDYPLNNYDYLDFRTLFDKIKPKTKKPENGETNNRVIEQERSPKEKKFPFLLVAVGVAALITVFLSVLEAMK